jgi:hypothetical protein
MIHHGHHRWQHQRRLGSFLICYLAAALALALALCHFDSSDWKIFDTLGEIKNTSTEAKDKKNDPSITLQEEGGFIENSTTSSTANTTSGSSTSSSQNNPASRMPMDKITSLKTNHHNQTTITFPPTAASALLSNTLHRNSKNATTTNIDILFIVMGEAKYFSSWYEWLLLPPSPRSSSVNIIQQMSNTWTVTLLYGSFDEPIQNDCNSNLHDNYCHARYIPNTTWTQGRNQLAAEALRLERGSRRRDKEQPLFDYWVFADEDIEIGCSTSTTRQNRTTTSTQRRNHTSSTTTQEAYDDEDNPRVCWHRFVQFLASPDRVPSRATTISIHYLDRWTSTRNERLSSTSNDGEDHGHHTTYTQLYGVSTQDPMLAAFPRRFVPYLLPYATLEPGVSEWASQAIVMCIMKTCFPSSALYVPQLSLFNRQHRTYLRGNFSTATILSTLSQNHYYDTNHDDDEHDDDSFWASICAAPDLIGVKSRPDQDKIGPFGSPEEFDAMVPPFRFMNDDDDDDAPRCAFLSDRFSKWEQSVLSY